MPALRATGSRRAASPREVGGPNRRSLERTLVAAQTAVSLVLLVFAALFVRSLQNLWAQDPGYDRSNVVMFAVDAQLAGIKGPNGVRAYATLLDSLRALPAVTGASASAVAPVSLDSYFVDSVSRAGTNVYPDKSRVRVAFNYVAPGYFSTLGIPLVAGRDFNDGDGPAAPKVAIVTEKLAAKFTGNPVGQQIEGSWGTAEVIGIARNNRYAGIRGEPRDVVYTPMFQSDAIGFAPTFEIRHAGPASDVLRAAREATSQVDNRLTIFRPNTLTAYTRDSFSRERLMAMLSTYLGAFALLLACIGLYGLMAYTVAQRTPEIGLRMALGSLPSGITRLVLRDSSLTVIAGALAGLAAAWLLAGRVDMQLFNLQSRDPLAFGVAIAVLLSLALVAAYLPARRAARINPIIALRQE